LGAANRPQTEPPAAAFVADREAPAADAEARAVAPQHFADAAGSGRDDCAGLAAMGAEQHRERIGLGNEVGEADVTGDELVAPRPVADTRQAGAERTTVPIRHRQSGRLECAADGPLDLDPR